MTLESQNVVEESNHIGFLIFIMDGFFGKEKFGCLAK